MTVNKAVYPDSIVFTVDGKIDSSASKDLELFIDEALEVIPDRVVFDFSGVSYVSSRGLRILIKVKRKLGGRPVVLKNPNSVVSDLVRMSGVESMFVIE